MTKLDRVDRLVCSFWRMCAWFCVSLCENAVDVVVDVVDVLLLLLLLLLLGRR